MRRQFPTLSEKRAGKVEKEHSIFQAVSISTVRKGKTDCHSLPPRICHDTTTPDRRVDLSSVAMAIDRSSRHATGFDVHSEVLFRSVMTRQHQFPARPTAPPADIPCTGGSPDRPPSPPFHAPSLEMSLTSSCPSILAFPSPSFSLPSLEISFTSPVRERNRPQGLKPSGGHYPQRILFSSTERLSSFRVYCGRTLR
jgi:hypothetical protein